MERQNNERIFISYKRVDKDRVFEIKEDIEKNTGAKCWIDLDGIESDAQFVDVIMNAIDCCDIFLFMRSKAHNELNNNRTDWTIREVNYALEQKKRIVFIDLDNTPWPRWFKFMFPNQQETDASDSNKLNKLYENIRSWLKNLDEGLPMEAEREDKKKKTRKKTFKSIISDVFLYTFGTSFGFGIMFCIIWIPFGLYSWLIAPKIADKGNTYFYGTTEVPQDYTRAVKTYKWATGGSKITNPKFATAAYNLAQCYENGWGTAINHEDAFKKYKQAARRDHSLAMYKVAQCYLEGTHGCKVDTVQAKNWYLRAIDKGLVEAQQKLDKLNGHISQ